MNSLRYFIALCGSIIQIKCGQGTTTFVGSKNQPNETLPEVATGNLPSRKNICGLNTPCTSHAGGVWECQFRTVRNVLNSALCLSPVRLNDSSLTASLYEATNIVNSQSREFGTTPNQLITLKATSALTPPGKFARKDFSISIFYYFLFPVFMLS